jgi:hypothetical protein
MTDRQVKEKALEYLNNASHILEQIAEDDTLCALGGVIEEVGDIEV